MTDLAARMRTLADLVLHQAWASETVARTLAKECGRTVRDLEALLKGWELEDHPDGPLFSGLPQGRALVRDELTKAGVDPDAAVQQVREKVQEATGVVLSAPAPPIAAAPSGGGKLPRRQAQQRGTVETVREWWVYRGDTTDRVGTVNATTEPSALALAIDLHGPDVWVCPAGEAPALPGPTAKAAPVPADDPVAIAAAMLDLARASAARGLQVIPAPSALEPVPITLGEKAAWENLAAECPAGLDRFVHQAGQWIHGTMPGVGGIICAHKDVLQPADWQPSPAQVAAWKAARESSPPVSQPEPGGPMDLRHVSWDATCTFFVLLDDHRPVECTWHPDHAHAQGCGEPGRLEMRGPVSAEGFRATPIPPSQRNEPLAEVARRRAQEAHDAEQMRLASPGKVKEPARRKRVKKGVAE